jgi:CheY-like chemotaxis protein
VTDDRSIRVLIVDDHPVFRDGLRSLVERAPDLVLHFANGYDPKGALARTEVFGRSALTGMHTYDDSLFFVNRAGVDTEGLDIVDLAPSILTLLGVAPPGDMDGRVRASA